MPRSDPLLLLLSIATSATAKENSQEHPLLPLLRRPRSGCTSWAIQDYTCTVVKRNGLTGGCRRRRRCS